MIRLATTLRSRPAGWWRLSTKRLKARVIPIRLIKRSGLPRRTLDSNGAAIILATEAIATARWLITWLLLKLKRTNFFVWITRITAIRPWVWKGPGILFLAWRAA